MRRIILNLEDDDNGILALRTGIAAYKRRNENACGRDENYTLIEFEDGTFYAAKQNKHSVSVWRQGANKS